MKHQFSLFLSSLSELLQPLKVGDELIVTNETFCNRLFRILRIQKGEEVIFFDKNNNVLLDIISIKKNICRGIIKEKREHLQLKPAITFLLPILKKDALEDTIYSLTALGVNEIQLINTQKIQRKWGSKKEYDRLKRIIIAAAEQSKQYAFPQLLQPTSLDKAVEKSDGNKVFFDLSGSPIFDFLKGAIDEKPSQLHLIIGPEGDLTDNERQLVKEHEFTSLSLTPTVLRASQAAALGAGIFRSVL